jgi:hypothetical protein
MTWRVKFCIILAVLFFFLEKKKRAVMEFYKDKLLFIEKGLEGFIDFIVNINFFSPYF